MKPEHVVVVESLSQTWIWRRTDNRCGITTAGLLPSHACLGAWVHGGAFVVVGFSSAETSWKLVVKHQSEPDAFDMFRRPSDGSAVHGIASVVL